MVAVLETRNLTKSFGTNQVLKSINLSFRAGEVTSLLGANGAGKSTFLGCISGAEIPSSGAILVEGVEHNISTPRDALQAGIGMIYQHFQLIGSLSISDNVFLGSEIRTSLGRTNRRAQEQETLTLLRSLGLELDPATKVEHLSVGQQQVIEIIRSLRRDPKVLILDEPTAALSHAEVEALLGLVSDLAKQRNMAIIYVSHILSEVMQVSDRVVVLRDGEVLEDRIRGNFSLEDLIKSISPDKGQTVRQRACVEKNRTLLHLTGLCGSVVGPIDLRINENEIIGLFGLLGSGRSDLLETLAGVKAQRSGQIELEGKRLVPRTPGEAASAGIVLVPADRKEQALFPALKVVDNVVLPHMKILGRKGIRSKSAELGVFSNVADALGVQPRDPNLPGAAFSGGNAQKLMIGRWTSPVSQAKVLLLDEPTQGVDIGAREDIYTFIQNYVSLPGRCAIFSTSDYEEAIALSDRIIVLHEGEVQGIVDTAITEAELMALAFGPVFSSSR